MKHSFVRHSIKRQFALIYIFLMVAVIFLCWLVNTMFLGKYYYRSKVAAIRDAYGCIKTAAENHSYKSESFQKELDTVCNRNNIAAIVIDEESETIYSSNFSGDRIEMFLYGFMVERPYEDAKVIEETEEYRFQQSRRNGSEFLEMYGRVSSGIAFLMSIPLEPIDESADLANRFFFYVGIIGTILGGVIIWLVVGKITKPILSLNEISEKMVHLDFDAKYDGKAKNEIGILGENMNKLSQSLEQTISELKSANNELQRDIEKKEKTDEMRREFLSNVSHELKTPIALIRGYAEALQEGIGEDPESRDYYCEVIVDESVKMNQMVQKLLTLNQLEFGREVVQMERFDLTMLIRNQVEQGKLLAQKDGITLDMEEAPTYHVWADAYMTEEVFQNYLSNAFHYCAGEKRIKIRLEKVEGRIRVSVYNTGAPIPEESIPYLWDKFYKVDKARTREYGGSGVGLSIVKAIMESMNHKYGVENVQGGVVFWFELECADAAEEDEKGKA